MNLQVSLQPDVSCQAMAQAQADPVDFGGVETAEFLAIGGGGAPYYNEIALEKNMLYFQRSLQALGRSPDQGPIFFANGNSGHATLRYLNEWDQEKFKVPEIPDLRGPATLGVVSQVFERIQAAATTNPLLVYFSGHGYLNPENADNNAMILWGEGLLDVQTFATQLDALPTEKPVVVMMAQCFSGSFANLIYEGGDPEAPVALQSRCGFFATTKDLPSVGCTPEVDEADYRDYSSSFFAGLTGIDRVGKPVASADYDGSGQISYSEAHAFAKIDEVTSDRPISTLEAWLQRQLSDTWMDITVRQYPIQQILADARSERRAVIRALGDRLQFNSRLSFQENVERLGLAEALAEAEGVGDSELELTAAYAERLRMELLNVVAEQRVLSKGTEEQKAILVRLRDCEGQSPAKENG